MCQTHCWNRSTLMRVVRWVLCWQGLESTRHTFASSSMVDAQCLSLINSTQKHLQIFGRNGVALIAIMDSSTLHYADDLS